MSSELEMMMMDPGNNGRRIGRRSPAIKKAQAYRDELQLQAFVASGQAQLAKHVGDQVVDLHYYLQGRANGDEVLTHLLTKVEIAYVSGLTNGKKDDSNVWGF
ncbi:hypothetical protein [Arthrobacter sp. EpRS71]|uniref:hypothetical protein n=1 Tax=Arthrobacter sp. EpRS71 TaxID=1743141 RepID=UPI00074A4C18|nr:hypothetical protein [Arthrobacter sp. EpRS71]KUM39032.1 hypothetical protein AR689_07710 [Arthrobacter sp. EpRS71]